MMKELNGLELDLVSGAGRSHCRPTPPKKNCAPRKPVYRPEPPKRSICGIICLPIKWC